MCGIVGGIAERNLVPILVKGLARLEYRGYDSSGVAVIDQANQLSRVRSIGKIQMLENKINHSLLSISGSIGIAHTRWTTHGAPSENNAHPHICNNEVAVVHNGIIENYLALQQEQEALGYTFSSETDTEVIAHAIFETLKDSEDLYVAVRQATEKLEGAYALGVISPHDPNTLIAACKGSPLVIGVGIGEHFIASDVSALQPVTNEFIFLENDDIAIITCDGAVIFDKNGELAEREIKRSSLTAHAIDLGDHRHFMHKEIFEQPQAIIDTLEGRVSQDSVLPSAFGHQAEAIFKEITNIQIVACGTSYHAGLVAKYWFEYFLRLPCSVEVASEFRYRNPVIQDNTLFVTLSQSGETADTVAALHSAKYLSQILNIPTLTICNAAESSLTRESDLTFLTHAGPEIGVASTKAFTTQLVALALLAVSIGKVQSRISHVQEKQIVQSLHQLPKLVRTALESEDEIKTLAAQFIDKESTIFLGRGVMYPIALEGALKLKEISYIHAEAFAAGELKHGPLALIDEKIPVVSLAPNNDLLDKLKSNLQEVSARGGQVTIFEDNSVNIDENERYQQIKIGEQLDQIDQISAPILFNIPLQLLSYHVALIKGTDVDQPRNLAKSVTVE